jgi:hypothetical protein
MACSEGAKAARLCRPPDSKPRAMKTKLIFLLTLSACSAALADAYVLKHFKFPTNGTYTMEGTMTVAGQHVQTTPLTEHCAGGASDAAASAKGMAQAGAFEKSLNLNCKSTVLEDTAARAKVHTECSAGQGTRTLWERIDANTIRFTTTVQVPGSGADHSKTVVTQRFTGKPCTPSAATGPAIPPMPKADPAVCAEGKAEIAKLRARPDVPAMLPDQMTAALKMQGCAL